jgi:exonuclease III
MRERLHVISWNIRAGRHLQAKLEAILSRNPDLFALQEVTQEGAAYIKQNLKGYFVTDTLDYSSSPSFPSKERWGVLIASRWKFSVLSPLKRPELQKVWPRDLINIVQDMFHPERFLAVKVDSPWGHIEALSAHIRPASSHKPATNPTGWIKVYMIEAIYQRLAHESSSPRILCGDFNTPKEEIAEGHCRTWAKLTKKGSFTAQRGYDSRLWDETERKIISGLANFDLPDTYRLVNGYGNVRDFSYYARGNGRRYDHIFASRSLFATKCGYLHSLREAGLSDHSPIEATFRPDSVKVSSKREH